MSAPDPQRVYADAVALIEANGWQREEPGSGWWVHDSTGEDATLADALDSVLAYCGIDTRKEPGRV